MESFSGAHLYILLFFFFFFSILLAKECTHHTSSAGFLVDRLIENKDEISVLFKWFEREEASCEREKP